MTSTETGAARRDDTVDLLHGEAVADPYRWLEDAGSEETQAFVRAQGARARAFLDASAKRAPIRARLEALWDHPKAGVPWRRGDRWFCSRNSGLQAQSVLYVLAAPDDTGEVLIDPNTWSEDGTRSLGGVGTSHDGALMAYAVSEAGSDWHTWHVLDVATRADLPDVVPWSKFSGATWPHDGSGFFYGRYEPPADGALHAAVNLDQQLRFHRLGADASEDPIVLVRPDQPRWGWSPGVTEDGRWLVVGVWEGTDPRNRVWLAELDGGDPAAVEIRPWLDDFDAGYAVVGTIGDELLVRTDLDADRGRLLAIDPHDPRSRRVLVPEGRDVLEAARVVGDRIVTVHMVDAAHAIRLYELDGRPAGDVDLGELVSVAGMTGRQEDRAFYFSSTSFSEAGTIQRHDLDTGATTVVREGDLSVPGIVAERVFVTSADGTPVPLFVVHRADSTADGTAPALLYAYGGFEIPLTPQAKVSWLVWLGLGGVLGVVCARGGGEYGRAWHDAGRLANKERTFDDVIAAAEWLTAEGWAAPGRLALNGGSNGGLTVGAVMTRRPELLGAALPEVGVLDMLRFHKFTIGWGWASDYGTADDAEQFAVLRRYSPYHNLVDGHGLPADAGAHGRHRRPGRARPLAEVRRGPAARPGR